MKREDYMKIYHQLGINVQPLPEHYDPETYGRMLYMKNREQYCISYSSSTDYKESN